MVVFTLRKHSQGEGVELKIKISKAAIQFLLTSPVHKLHDFMLKRAPAPQTRPDPPPNVGSFGWSGVPEKCSLHKSQLSRDSTKRPESYLFRLEWKIHINQVKKMKTYIRFWLITVWWEWYFIFAALALILCFDDKKLQKPNVLLESKYTNNHLGSCCALCWT